MDIRIDDSCFDLRAHQIARFDDASGVVLLCLRGELWLTQDDDLNDVILGPGEHFTFDRRGLALVEALKASSLRIAMPVERRAEDRSWHTRDRTARCGWPVVLAPGLAIRTS